MKRQSLLLFPFSIAILAVVLLPLAGDAQTPSPGVTGTAAAKTPARNATGKTWTQPRTPDGQPDLQGVWSNRTITPFERPVELGTKAYWTEAEAAAIEKRAVAEQVDRPPKPGDPGSYNQAWTDTGTKVFSTRQTSLVVDPPDGRVPLTPWSEAKRDYAFAHLADSYEYQTTWDRCITRGVPGGFFPAGYNNAYRIMQTPGYVVILSEMIHETRAIPTDGRSHLPSNIRQWNGDSVGHWEGNTLVVDTTNYSGQGMIATSAATARIKGVPESEALHVVERFTRSSAGTISYEVTIDDPNAYTRSWKVAMPLTLEPDYAIYEYACHEGNLAMVDILSAGRAQDRAAGPAKAGSK
jgi:hypothetical protein